MNSWFFLLIPFVFISSFASHGQDNARISGRVVDEFGKPVRNAQVLLLSEPCDSCTDHIDPSVLTNEDGVFFFLDTFGIEKARLFVVSEVPKGIWLPIISSSLISSGNPRFRGISLNLSRAEYLNLGDIEPTVEYRIATLNLRQVFSTDVSNYRCGRDRMALEIRDDIGRLTITNDVPLSAVEGVCHVKLALPVGTWLLKFSINTDKGTLAGSTKLKL